jgi:hypothetical protein
MDVFREVELTWQGQKYRLKPDASVLRQIKGQGLNNLRLAHECIHGGADPSELAVALRIFLGAAGVRATDDECYSYLVSGDMAGITEFQWVYCQTVLPNIDLGKKPEAPAEEVKPGPVPQAKT